MALVNGTSHQGPFYHFASQRTLAPPLPRLTTPPPPSETERYEVLVIGAGPAGLFLTLLLTRYGLSSPFSLLCVDEAPHATKTGHADGIMCRTLEVLRSLDLADEIVNYAAHVREFATWKWNEARPEGSGIERTELMRIKLGEEGERFVDGFECIHQGRVERILEDDLRLYFPEGCGVARKTTCVDVRIEEESNREYPVVAILESGGVRREVRAKYLVGADGGRSVVRGKVGIKMEGQTTSDVWGVVDLVADSDYPDLRRQSSIGTKEGRIILHIPRERKSNGDWITRMYVPFLAEESKGAVATAENGTDADDAERNTHDQARANITLERILSRVQEALRPYRFKIKEDTDIEWWAAYQIGQRVAERFTVSDSQQHPRVFLIGDACHTHSPKLGQGMNVSMMDAFDLSWKLVHVLFGLTKAGTLLLNTYEQERRDNALNLIDLDKRFYASRYAKAQATESLSSNQQMWMEITKFISGTAVEYEAGSILVDTRVTSDDMKSLAKYSAGGLREGRRLADAMIFRFADGNFLHLHDEMESNGRYSVVVWTGKDLLDKNGASQSTLKTLCECYFPKLPKGLVKLFVLHSLDHMSFEWSDLLGCIKEESEMRLYKAEEKVYEKYGLNVTEGAMCVVRPDGFVGTITDLSDSPSGLGKLTAYLSRCLTSPA